MVLLPPSICTFFDKNNWIKFGYGKFIPKII